MGAQTKTVGGGAATGVANGWNQFLQQQLMGQPQAANPQLDGLTQMRNQLSSLPGFKGNLGKLDAEIARQQSNAQQPMQQSNSAFQSLYNNAASGQIGDQSGAGAAIQNFFQNPSNNFQLPQFQNPYTAPQYQNVNLSQLPTNFGVGQNGMADLSGYGNAAQSNFNTNQNLGSVNSGYDSILQGMLKSGGGGANGFAAAQLGPQVNMTPQMSFADAMGQLGNDPYADMKMKRAIADNNARFGAEGAGALGTGAQYSNALLQSDLLAQDASNRRAQAMQLMGQDLAGQQALANVGLQNRAQDLNLATANMQGGLQGAANQNNVMSALLGATGQARGQDLSTGLGMRGQNLDQQGQGLQQSMFNAGQQNNMTGNMLNAVLQNQGLGNQYGLSAAQLNNAAMQNNNLNALNQNQFLNNFNMNNAQNNAQFQQGANAQNSQNLYNAQSLNNNMFQNMIGQGMNMNQMGNQNQMNLLAQLFGAYGQSNGLGTPQAQMVQQQSPWGQAAQAALGIGGTLLGGPMGRTLAGALGRLFGGGSGGMTGGALRPQIYNTPSAAPSNPIGSYMPTLSMGYNPMTMPTLNMGF